MVEKEPDEIGHAQLLGERLRHLRQQQQLSLHDVEARSAGELKASVVGAYERGERTISITRLQRLAEFFRVPVAELLPVTAPADPTPRAADDVTAERVVIDLAALERRRRDEPVLVRYVDAIAARRGDFNGRVLTVRAADLDTLAAVMDMGSDQLLTRLVVDGLVRTPR